MFFENRIFRDKKSAWKKQGAAEHRRNLQKGVERRTIKVKGAQQSRRCQALTGCWWADFTSRALSMAWRQTARDRAWSRVAGTPPLLPGAWEALLKWPCDQSQAKPWEHTCDNYSIAHCKCSNLSSTEILKTESRNSPLPKDNHVEFVYIFSNFFSGYPAS